MSASTKVSSVLKTSMPSPRSASSAKKVVLKDIVNKRSSGGKKVSSPLSAKTRSGTAVKPAKSTLKSSSLSSALKSLISKAKKLPAMGMPSSVGAPTAAPSPAFFGTPNAGPGKIGLDM